jgi:hypothetical protein
MNRAELCEICKAYTIITQNKRNERLISEILDAQAKYSTNKQIQDDLTKTEIIVETVIPENNEIIDEFLNYKVNDNIVNYETILENKKPENRLGSILGILNRSK